ncbi:MAG: hypothetical protein CMN02_08720 [Roseibacillus sp.]|nr:hypothetical protein [Roseibacillus sp.]
MGQKITASHFSEIVSKHENFVLLSHARPDGDAIGSVVALKAVLEELGKHVVGLNEDPVPDNLRFMRGSQGVQCPSGSLDAEVVIALDTANRERLGERCLDSLSGDQIWVNIDHHISNEKYGDYWLIDVRSAATAEILYAIIRELNWPLPDIARDALYVALSTDTGSFQYSNTSGRSHKMAADLVEQGLDVVALTSRLYHDYPLRRVELLRCLLETMQLSDDGRIAWWTLSRGTKKRIGIQAGDGEGLIDVLRAIQGVLVCGFIEEMDDGKIRFSLRSKNSSVNVCDICAQFGGGGHALAAGAKTAGPLDEAVLRFVEVTQKALPSRKL